MKISSARSRAVYVTGGYLTTITPRKTPQTQIPFSWIDGLRLVLAYSSFCLLAQIVELSKATHASGGPTLSHHVARNANC